MLRIGQGYDVHRYAQNRDLILGGVKIPFELGLDGHSDADVLTHAIMDAIVGALALGDIGKFFPDTDPKYKDADSILLLNEILNVMSEKGYKIVNVDATIVADHIVLEAEDLGLSSCWLTYFDPEIIRNEFNIPSNLEPIAIIAVGYADTEKASPDRHSKDRKALESLVCYETF